VLSALGAAVTKMRGDLGESLASVEKYDVPIEQATTRSLEALEAFSQGVEQRIQAKDFQAIPFMERAIELDEGFALAHGRLGTAYMNTGQFQKAQQHWQRAYELREGVSEPERLYILSWYYTGVLGDLRKGTEIYEQWISTYPRDFTPHNNLALWSNFMGQHERYLEQALEAVRVGGNFLFAHSNLFFAYFNLNRTDEARATLENAMKLGFGEKEVAGERAHLAIDAGDREAAIAHLEPWVGTAREPRKLFLQGSLEAAGGQLAAGRASARRQSELAAKYSGDGGVAQANLNLANRLMDFGYEEEPAELARGALRLARDRDTVIGATAVLARLGDPAEVEPLIAELQKRWPQDTLVQERDIPLTRATLALRAGDAAEALHILETPRPFERSALRVLQRRGEAYLAANRSAEAVTEFQKLVSLDHVRPFLPIHSLAHLWLARAHLASGESTAARASYEQFLEIMANADEGIPAIEKARQEYATIPGAKG
jgi:tetratricopeptide (TPR) repeat protein